MLSRKITGFVAGGAAALAVAAGGYTIEHSNSSSTSGTAKRRPRHPRRSPGRRTGGGGGSNARSGPAAGGAAGTVDSVSTSGFTISTSAGQKVTINEASSTTYQNGTSAISASAITTGEPVLVLGRPRNDHHRHAGHRATDRRRTASSSAATVVPFQRGAPTTSKQAGQIPANYTEGSGTIVSGTTANKATEAALAAYPGGVVDRVVQLSNGQYEVHNIGVNWPHHIFVNQNFTGRRRRVAAAERTSARTAPRSRT